MRPVASLSDVLSIADTDLLDALLAWQSDGTWRDFVPQPAWRAVVGGEPSDHVPDAMAAEVDEVAEALARIIDDKAAPWEHSVRVARSAQEIARELGMSAPPQRRLYRAGLLHDIGKLRVADRLLETPGPLTPSERQSLEWHPIHTWEILSQVPVFQDIARIAALHHERLDGSGYPWRLGRAHLDREACILAVAEAYVVMTDHQPALSCDSALSILHEDAGTRLDAAAIFGLTRHLKGTRTSVTE